MGDLILHIGTTKTGTTSLQKFFFDNRKKLMRYGIGYPEFTYQPKSARRCNGIFINQLCYALTKGQDPYQHVQNLDENLKRLALAFSSNHRVILTDECFSYYTGLLLAAGHSPEIYWTTLAQTLSKAGMQDVTVVVYLRRQDDWVASQWREDIKSGWRGRSIEALCNLDSTRYTMNYASILKSVRTAFGNRAKIAVRRYDRSTFEGGTIYHDFCAAVGIPWDDGYRIPKTDANLSLSYDVAEALRSFKEIAPPRESLRREVLVPLARQLTTQNPDAPDTTPFNEETTRKLLEPYLEGNEQISERYLEGEPLFSEEYGGRPIWIPNEKRIAEYHTIFEDAIRQYKPPSNSKNAVRTFARSLPESIKQPLRIVRREIFNR